MATELMSDLLGSSLNAGGSQGPRCHPGGMETLGHTLPGQCFGGGSGGGLGGMQRVLVGKPSHQPGSWQ